MAYTVLARRYRSNTFDEVVGQNHIAQTLKKAIQSGRIAHAYLFCGTRGTGKTSTARILAKCLNCQSADQAVIEPCNKCDSCKSIARGDDIDVIEIDAASNTGVDNVRDIIIGTAYNTPARSRFKVFIIDEVHMLSKQAFNALLKTLEEPPSHVKFILATTEPEKVLPTILSRCQRYDFRNIPTREIAGHLKNICKTEKIEADDDALLLVAKAGAGSMRDSLSLLDRLLSIGETKLTVELLEQMLGLPKSQLIFDLCAAIGEGNVQSALSQADAVIANGLAVDTLIVSLIDHLRNLMLLRTCGTKSDLVEVPGLSLVDLAKQAEKFDAAALSQDIVILEELRRHVRQSQAGRALLDATLVRMSLADQFSSLSELAECATGGAGQKKKSESGAGSGGVRLGERSTFNAQRSTFKEDVAPTSDAVPSFRSSTLDVQRSTFASNSNEKEADAVTNENELRTSNVELRTSIEEIQAHDDDDALPAPGRVWDGPRESLTALMAKQAATIKAQVPSAAPASGDFSDRWQAVIAMVAGQSPAMPGLLQEGRFIGLEDGQAVIRYSAQYGGHIKLLEYGNKKEMLREALSKVMDRAVGVRFEISESVQAPEAVAAKPPAVQPSRKSAPEKPPLIPAENSNLVKVTEERRAELYQSVPLVRAIVDQLGGTVIRIEE